MRLMLRVTTVLGLVVRPQRNDLINRCLTSVAGDMKQPERTWIARLDR